MSSQQDEQQQQQQQLHHTYIAGEGAHRLELSARQLGLTQRRRVRLPVRLLRRLFENDAAVHMHSIGYLGANENIDNSGTLHYVSVSRRKKVEKKPEYGTLQDLFQRPTVDERRVVATRVEETDEEDEEVVVIQDSVAGGSLGAAIFGIIKGTVGPAILYLPHGFLHSGYAVAIPSMLFATSMFIYNSYRLLACWKVESTKQHEMAQHIEQVLGLTTIQETKYTPTLLTYPELARRALGRGACFVELGIALMQFGVCLTYLIFVPQNLYECTRALSGGHYLVSKQVFLWIMIGIEIPLSWIADIRKLTPTNVLATLLIAYGLCSVLILAVFQGLEQSDSGEICMVENLQNLPVWTDSWFIFIGTSFFMMEGSITLIVPLQEAVFDKEDRDLFPRINQTVTSWIVVFYIFFSITCVAAFGDDLRTALTASLTGTLAMTIQLAYSIAVILTFPLQAFPAMQVTVTAVLGKTRDTTRRSVLATVLTLLLGLIAMVSIDYLGNVVSILGSLFGIPLALVFPPIMHNRLCKPTFTERCLNYAVMVIGFVAMGAASVATIATWDENAEG